MGLYIAVLANLGQLTRDIIRLSNGFQLIEGSLFAIINLLAGAKAIPLYFIWRVGDDFSPIFRR